MRPVGSKYLLEEPLGRGATGTVWRAQVRDESGTGAVLQQVAIKVLKEELATDPDVVMRFLRERSVLLRLVHPNIVRVRDLVVEGELLALVMDLIDGPDLHRYLRSHGPLSPVAGAQGSRSAEPSMVAWVSTPIHFWFFLGTRGAVMRCKPWMQRVPSWGSALTAVARSSLAPTMTPPSGHE